MLSQNSRVNLYFVNGDGVMVDADVEALQNTVSFSIAVISGHDIPALHMHYSNIHYIHSFQLASRILAHGSILYSTRTRFKITTLRHPTKQCYADIVYTSALHQTSRMLIRDLVFTISVWQMFHFAVLQGWYHRFCVNEMCLNSVRRVDTGTYFAAKPSTH